MIVGIIRRKPVLTYASIIFGDMLASVNSVKEGREGIKRLHAKFHLNVFIVSASRGQKTHGKILTFWGLLYRRPFTDEGQI